MGSVRRRRGVRRRVRIGAPDPTLTPVSGMVAVTELVERLDVIGRLDAAVGPIKQRRRGHTAGQVLVGMAAAQLAGEDFLVGLDRQRADRAGQAAGPGARAGGDDRGRAGAAVVRRAVGGGGDRARRRARRCADCCCPRERAAALGEDVTIDLDTTDVEVYGRHKRGVAYNHQGQRVGRPHVATWADTATVLAADLLAGNEDPRRDARCAAAPGAGRAARRGAGRADPAARRRRLLRRATGPRRPVRRHRVRHRSAADRAAVAAARRARRGGLDRRDRHGRRAGRRRRLLPELVARRDPAADPPGPPRRRPPGRAGISRPAGPSAAHPAPRPARPAARRARRPRRRVRLLVHRHQPRRLHRRAGRRGRALVPPPHPGRERVPRRQTRRRAAPPAVGLSRGQPGVDVGRAAGRQPHRLAAPAHRHRPAPTAAWSGTVSATARP